MPKKPTKISILEQQVADLTEALQRERADAENIRRRHQAQMEGLREIVKGAVVKELLPAIDNLERALAHTPADIAEHDYVKGVSGVVKQFEKVLAELGVQRIKTVGEEFNPYFHEAVSTEGDGQKEVISEELQAGYVIDDQVIRHAMVKVTLE